MTLSELLAEVGDDNLAFQNLDDDTALINIRPGVAKVTFNTAPAYVEGPEHVGLVVWIPRDLLPAEALG